MSPDTRRTYYDHEPAYRDRLEQGHRGWSVSSDDGAYDRIDEFLASGRLPSPGIVLDTGCGGGELCIRLCERGWRAIGIEFAETALQLARQNARNAHAAAAFARVDLAQTWPFGENTFDLLLDNHVMHCLIDAAHRTTYLENAYRVLRPGGAIFSVNMSAEGCLNRARYNIDPDTNVDASHTRIWVSQQQMLSAFAGTGFAVHRCERYAPHNADECGDELVLEATKH